MKNQAVCGVQASSPKASQRTWPFTVVACCGSFLASGGYQGSTATRNVAVKKHSAFQCFPLAKLNQTCASLGRSPLLVGLVTNEEYASLYKGLSDGHLSVRTALKSAEQIRIREFIRGSLLHASDARTQVAAELDSSIYLTKCVD